MRPFLLVLPLLAALPLSAQPLSRSVEVDFFRDTPGRNLRGLAVRSDGRVLAGPTQRELPGTLPAEILWSLAPTADGRRWLVGTGPDGKVLEVNTDVRGDFQAEVAADLDATHVFAVLPLPDGAFLAGTSPQGTLALVRGGQVVASLALPADSVLDLVPAPGADGAVLVATGNPGRIYRVDLAAFAQAGVAAAKADDAALARAGITRFGEVRDRNVRRLLVLGDGRVVAGSAPKGNVYAFPAAGGAPRILLENREAEVTDLLADGPSAFFAALTLGGASGESRVNRPAPPAPAAGAPVAAPAPETAEPDRAEKFAGRAQLVHFPADGLPEVVMSRANTAFYALAWHEEQSRRWVLVAGGEQGELAAYAPAERRSYNLGAAPSAQVNALRPSQRGAKGLFHLLRNNPAGLSQLNFFSAAERRLDTRKIDLGVPAELGQLRFAQVAGPSDLVRVAARTSFGSDELEGWSEWTPLAPVDGGWHAPGLRGRWVQLRVSHAQVVLDPPVVDKATLHFLPQNRRPQLTDFRILPANLGLVPVNEPNPAAATTTLGQVLFPNPREGKDDARRKGGVLNSPVVPAPGAQVVFWTLGDPDDDTLAATFALAPEGTETWTDLAIDTTESHVQFEVGHLPEGRYRSRLTVRELAPRPTAQRLTHVFETDVLVVDRTPPEVLSAAVERLADGWRVTVAGLDQTSLLEGAEFVLNNGVRAAVEQPADGIRDSRRETFVAEFPAPRAAGATSVEVLLYDRTGNSASRRLPLR
jgi:hypothetical protein